MSDSLIHIGKNIRAVRKSKNLTLEVLSGLTGVSESFLGMVERGVSNVSVETLIALCDALDMSADALLMEGREVIPRPTDKRDTLLTMIKKAPDEELDFLIEYVKFYRGRVKF